MADVWFTIPYRDKEDNKYDIVVYKIDHNPPGGADGSKINVNIEHENIIKARFSINFTNTWICSHSNRLILDKITQDENGSRFISDLLLEFIFEKEIQTLNGKQIDFFKESEYEKKIDAKIIKIKHSVPNPDNPNHDNPNHDNNIFIIEYVNYKKDRSFIIKENKFIRDLFLNELYFIQHNRGPSGLNYIAEQIHYNYHVIRNAFRFLEGEYVLRGKAKTISLTPIGFKYVEENIHGNVKEKADYKMDTPNNIDQDFEYDVALSFAGEQRDYVEKVYNYIKNNSSLRCFYDKDFEELLWGEDLTEILDEIYSKTSKKCVMFISTDYANKVWPTHEKKSALEKHVQNKGKYILPVRFDDTELPGLPSTISYIDGNDCSPEELGKIIIRKLSSE